MALSVFDVKEKQPGENNLKQVLGKTYDLWNVIRDYVREKYEPGIEEWNFAGKNWGWSFRMKDKKRAILYFTPLEKCFQNGFVFGDKAVASVEKSTLPESIKKELREAKKYMEGRGLRVIVKTQSDVKNIKLLVDIKMTI